MQHLLNKASQIVGSPRLSIKEDGLIGPKTINAIREFQNSQLGFNDGRVDPGHKTIGRLMCPDRVLDSRISAAHRPTRLRNSRQRDDRRHRRRPRR